MKKLLSTTLILAGLCVMALAGAPKHKANGANKNGNEKSPNEPPKKFTLCHNDKNPHTLHLPEPGYSAHLRQHPGDYPGACR